MSGPDIILTITLELRMFLQNISRRVAGNVLINIPPSNIFLIILLPARFHQNCLTVFGRCKHYWVKKALTPFGNSLITIMDYHGISP